MFTYYSFTNHFMITPVVIPVIVHEEEDVCPNCGKPEEIIEVCKHCKHEYEEDEDFNITWWDITSVILFFIWILWIICILFDWLFMADRGYSYKNSLREELSEQVEWFKDIKF